MNNERDQPLNKKILPTIIGIFIATLCTIIGLLPFDWAIKIFLIVFIAIFNIYIIIRYNRVIEYENFRNYKELYDNMNLLFHSKKLIKEIIIHNIDGTSTVSFDYDVKNISDKAFPTFTRTIYYDGVRESFELIINCKKFIWEEIDKDELLDKKGADNAFFLHFPIGLCSKETINIKIKYKVKNLYKNILNKNKEKTSFGISYPVDEIDLKICLEKNDNLKDYIICNDGHEINLETLKLEDISELNRFNREGNKLLPKGDQTKELTWKLINPKVGNKYSLKFHLKQNF